MRSIFYAALLSMLAILAAGCGPPVSEEELGRVVIGVPEIPEGYEPYALPSLIATDPAAPEDNSAADSEAEKDVESSPGDQPQ